ncbi:LysR substrate-binding domain-containing protein [Streptomyces sp. NPDC050164]|uniref:LysR substrate-binding domain-containing protein n=1 Tax=Streptomyces sp. NPDC050164 TaxID=3365605 RepID=UPI00379171D5
MRVTQGPTDPLPEDLRAGPHDLEVATRRPRGRALASAPLTDEESLLVAARSWTRRVEGRSWDELRTALRDVPLVPYAGDLSIVRRSWRPVLGRQLAARAALTVPHLYAVLSAVTAGAGYSVPPRFTVRGEPGLGPPRPAARGGGTAAEHAVPGPAAGRRRQPGRGPGPRLSSAGGRRLASRAR